MGMLLARGQDHCASLLTTQNWWAEQARGHAGSLGTQKRDSRGWHCLSPTPSQIEQWGTGYLHELPEPEQQVKCRGSRPNAGPVWLQETSSKHEHQWKKRAGKRIALFKTLQRFTFKAQTKIP